MLDRNLAHDFKSPFLDIEITTVKMNTALHTYLKIVMTLTDFSIEGDSGVTLDTDDGPYVVDV